MSSQLTSTCLSRCPPLRIRHFLVWTAVSAIALTAYRLPSDIGYLLSFGLAFVLGGSAGVTFCGFACVWAFRNEWHRSPGQGFLVYAAIYFAFALTDQLMPKWVGDHKTVLFEHVYTVDTLWNRIETTVSAVVALACAIAFADSLRWRVVYVLFASGRAATVLLCIGWDYFDYSGKVDGPKDMLFAVSEFWWQASFLATSVSLVWAIVRDRRLNVFRDWTHWAGVACWCLAHLPAVPPTTQRSIVEIRKLLSS